MKLFSSLLVASIALFVALSVRGADYPTSLPYGRSVFDYCAIRVTNLSIIFSQNGLDLNVDPPRPVANMDFDRLQFKARSLVRSMASNILSGPYFSPDEPVNIFVTGAGPSPFDMVYWPMTFIAEKKNGEYTVPSRAFASGMKPANFVPFWIDGLDWIILDSANRDGGKTHLDSRRNMEVLGPAWIMSGVLYIQSTYLLTGANGYSDTTITLGFTDGTTRTYASPIPKIVLGSDGKITVTGLELDDFVVIEFSRDLLHWETLTEFYFDGTNNSVNLPPSDGSIFYRLNPYR